MPVCEVCKSDNTILDLFEEQYYVLVRCRDCHCQRRVDYRPYESMRSINKRIYGECGDTYIETGGGWPIMGVCRSFKGHLGDHVYERVLESSY